MKSPKNPYPGLLIAFEGLDGSGLSTQAELLSTRLKRLGFKVLATKEPTNNVIGGIIRAALTSTLSLDSSALQLLFAADRSYHLDHEIIPALKNKSIVLTDRYYWSNIAFGSVDLDFDWLSELNKHFITPDITFFLDVPPKTSVQRMKKDRFEFELFETEKKLKSVREGYTKLIKKYPKQIKLIDAKREIEVINEEIFGIIMKNPKSRS